MTAAPPSRPRRKTGLWVAAAAALIAGCVGLTFVPFDRLVGSSIP